MRGASLLAVLLVVGALLMPVLLWVLLRGQVLDVPGARSSHDRPVPRGGGAAFVVLAGLAAVLTPDAGLLVCLALFGLLGFADDVRGLGAGLRLGLQAALSVTTVVLVLGAPGTTARALTWVVAVLFVVAFVNAFNFMDGINAISGLHAVLFGLYYLLVGSVMVVPGLAVLGALLAASGASFLPYNAMHARMFMGDAGSYLLGATSAAACVLCVTATGRPLLAVAPLVPYLVDTGGTLVQRAARRRPLLAPHRDHAYQHLADVRQAHLPAALVVGTWSFVAASIGLVASGGAAPVLLGACLLVVGLGYYASAHRGRSTPSRPAFAGR